MCERTGVSIGTHRRRRHWDPSRLFVCRETEPNCTMQQCHILWENVRVVVFLWHPSLCHVIQDLCLPSLKWRWVRGWPGIRPGAGEPSHHITSNPVITGVTIASFSNEEMMTKSVSVTLIKVHLSWMAQQCRLTMKGWHMERSLYFDVAVVNENYLNNYALPMLFYVLILYSHNWLTREIICYVNYWKLHIFLSRNSI